MSLGVWQKWPLGRSCRRKTEETAAQSRWASDGMDSICKQKERAGGPPSMPQKVRSSEATAQPVTTVNQHQDQETTCAWYSSNPGPKQNHKPDFRLHSCVLPAPAWSLAELPFCIWLQLSPASVGSVNIASCSSFTPEAARRGVNTSQLFIHLC